MWCLWRNACTFEGCKSPIMRSRFWYWDLFTIGKQLQLHFLSLICRSSMTFRILDTRFAWVFLLYTSSTYFSNEIFTYKKLLEDWNQMHTREGARANHTKKKEGRKSVSIYPAEKRHGELINCAWYWKTTLISTWIWSPSHKIKDKIKLS